MRKFTPFSLNIKGHLHEFDRPQVMGIINITPDSFYRGSRTVGQDAIARRIRQLLDEGADMIDIGAYSSRPGADDITAEEEISRLWQGMTVLRDIAPDAIVSVDTFRADVARIAIEEMGADIINDISGGDLDCKMPDTVAGLNVPYILMHMRGTPATMDSLTDYNDVTAGVMQELSDKLNRLSLSGVNDVIIDPGFGFSKTLQQNYKLLHDLEVLHRFNRPILIGISRKSMIFRALDSTPDDALNGTTVINTIALLAGASILRVHDVRQAVEAVKLTNLTINR